MARLGDVVKIEASSKSVVGDKFWLLNLDMVEQQTGNVIDYNYVGKDALNGSIIQFDTGCVLYSKLRPNLNKVVIPNQDGFATSEMLPLRPNTKMLTREYLTAFLRSDSFVTWAVSKTAGAKMPRLGTKELLSKEITLPSISEQTRIAGQFAKVDELIVLRKEQLAKLDQLVKSRFIELFGDPVDNPKNYLVESLRELIDKGYITYHLDGNHGGDYPRSEEFVDRGVPYIGANSIVNGEVDFAKAKYLTVERAAKLRKGIAQNDDVLFAHNATVGPVVVLHTVEPKVILSTSLTAYRCNKDRLLPNYLKAYMQSDGFVRQYADEMKQTTRNQVPITAQKKYLILVPPIEEQEQFAAFIEQTDKSKMAIQKSLDKLELLKKSLMQEYFGKEDSPI